MANTSESVLDQESLDTLRALDRPGQPSVLVKIVTTFLDSATVQADELRQAVAEIDLVGVRRVAHMLRSSAANVGAMGLSEICGRLEEAACDRNADAIAPLHDEFIAQHRAAESALKSELSGELTPTP